MSGTGSLMIRNLRKPSDYKKGVMTQDELLRLAISNDANVAGARKNFQAGVVEELSERASRSPAELQADTALQERNALDNLLKLFQYREAGEIIAMLNPDALFIMNATFPQIEKDIKSKFNVKLLSPSFFVEYLMKYIEELEASKGVSTNLSTITNKFNDLTDNINDIRALLPTNQDFANLQDALKKVFTILPEYVTQPVLDRIDALQRGLPTRADFISLEGKTEVDKYEILSELQEVTSNFPTSDQITQILADVQSGRVDNITGFQELQDAISGISDAQLEALQDIRNDLAESSSTGAKEPLEIIAQLSIPVAFLGNVIVARNKNAKGVPIGREQVRKVMPDGRTSVIDGAILSEEWKKNEQFRSWWSNNVRVTVEQNKPSPSTLATFIKANNTAGGKSASSSAISTAGTETTEVYGAKEKGGMGLLTKARNGRIKVQKVGKGVAYDPEPNYRQFGKYVINIPQLKERDILNVKFPSLGRIPQFKPTPISDVFKEFIIDLLETGKTSNRIYDQIPIEERQLFERIATGAGLIHTLKIKKTITDDDKADNDRFAILKGEYLAGNNSVALMKELRKLVVKFMGQGKISKTDGLNLLVELSV